MAFVYAQCLGQARRILVEQKGTSSFPVHDPRTFLVHGTLNLFHVTHHDATPRRMGVGIHARAHILVSDTMLSTKGQGVDLGVILESQIDACRGNRAYGSFCSFLMMR